MATLTDPVFFFTNQTSNGDSMVYAARFPGGRGQLTVWGVWDGATLTMKHSHDGSTYITTKDIGGGQLGGVVPAGYYSKLIATNTSGTPTYTYNSGQEVLL